MIRALLTSLLLVLAACMAAGVAYWRIGRRFVPGDAHALDGIVHAPTRRAVAFRNVAVWDGRGGAVQRDRSVLVDDGRIVAVVDAALPIPPGVATIEAQGKTLIPGLIDAHVHLMGDSGPDLLTRSSKLMDEWLATTRRYPESREPIVRRGQLKLKAGVTTMRCSGTGTTRWRTEMTWPGGTSWALAC